MKSAFRVSLQTQKHKDKSSKTRKNITSEKYRSYCSLSKLVAQYNLLHTISWVCYTINAVFTVNILCIERKKAVIKSMEGISFLS